MQPCPKLFEAILAAGKVVKDHEQALTVGAKTGTLQAMQSAFQTAVQRTQY
jgi:hypothetical protein